MRSGPVDVNEVYGSKILKANDELMDSELMKRLLTWSKTKTPPRKKARSLTPFLTKTPAQIPQTAPKESSNMFKEDFGGGGRGGRLSRLPVEDASTCAVAESGVLAG